MSMYEAIPVMYNVGECSNVFGRPHVFHRLHYVHCPATGGLLDPRNEKPFWSPPGDLLLTSCVSATTASLPSSMLLP